MEFGFNRGCKGRCQDNRFWDFTRCKWPLTGDDNMGISYEGWLVFSPPLRLFLIARHIVATWRIQLNHPSAAAMHLMSNYFDRLLSLAN